jgi:16S rRNA (cytidine1402-2'-O)-methyltransferase
MKTGTLHLIPSPIGTSMDVLAPYIVAVLESVPYIIAEQEKTVRRFLATQISQEVLAAKTFATLDEHTQFQELPALLAPLLAGQDGAIISEAGLPCVADPGSALVALAHGHHIRVIPHPGPSAIVQTLMASGLNGQRFMFEGYLPIHEQERAGRVRYLEALSGRENMTILWIETPYRVRSLFTSLCATLSDATSLTLGQALMTEEESIFTSTVGEWKLRALQLRKSPTVFALQALPDIKNENSGGKGSRPKKKSGARIVRNWNAGEKSHTKKN